MALVLACSEDAKPTAKATPSVAAEERFAVPVHPLPPLEPMVERLRKERSRIAAPGAVEQARKMFDPPAPPTLQRNVTAEAKVRAAIGQLADTLQANPSLQPHLASTLERAGSITILVDEEPDAQLRYDSLHDALKVPRCALSYPTPLLAIAVSHELLHAADHDELARQLDLDREQVALLQDIIGPQAMATERTLMEERACRFELQVARAFHAPIRRPKHPPRRVPGCSMTAEALMHMLAKFEEAESGPPGTFTRLLQSGPTTPPTP